MKVEYYNPVDEKGGCVVRSISKALDKDYSDVKKELLNINENYNDESIFEKYLLEHGFTIDEEFKDINISDIKLNGTNIVLAYDNDWYHMICIIDNIIYDKNSYDDLKKLKVIKTYKI